MAASTAIRSSDHVEDKPGPAPRHVETFGDGIAQSLSSRSIAFSPSIVAGLATLFDIVMVFGSGLLIYVLYLGWSSPDYEFYLSALAVNSLCVAAVFYFTGLYRFDSLSHPLQYIKRIVPNCMLVFVILLTFAFMFKISSNFSRVWAFSWLISATLLICAGRIVSYHLLLAWTRAGKITRNIAVVGGDEQGRRLLQHMNQHREPWNRIIGIFDDRLSRSSREVMGYPVLGSLDALLEYARKRRVDDVVVTLPWNADQRLHSIISRLRELPVNIHLGSDLAGYIYPRLSYRSIGDVPVLSVAQKPKPMSGWNVVLKTLEDRILSAIIVVLAAPILLLIALAIKLDSPGPVLFRQQRCGFNNKLFNVYKFRTMYHNRPVEADLVQATRDDPRVTRVGRFLRRTSLDELPQLFNVLQGNMSLVGPRPHPISMNDQYAALIGGYLLRHRVKPGITGWAQVSGLRGETEVPEKMQARVEHDIHYIENWSLTFDLQILLMTFFVGFVHKNAY